MQDNSMSVPELGARQIKRNLLYGPISCQYRGLPPLKHKR